MNSKHSKFAHIPVSPVYLTEYVRKVEARGIRVIRFDLAEPFFTPPEEAIEDTANAVKEGYYRYSPPRGLPELVEAIRNFLKRTRGLEYEEEEIVVTCGAKSAIYSALTSVLSPGDEIILITPFWVSFKAIPMMIGAKTVEVKMKKPFGLDEEALKEAISKRTKIIVINNPHNPTGWIFTKEELMLIRDIAIDHDLLVLSDEVDWAYVYEGKHISIASLPDMKDRTLLVDSFSKVFAMTGWRIGFAAGPKYLIDNILTIQQHSTSGPSTFAQKGCVGTLSKAEELVKNIVETCRRNRDLIVKEMSEIEGIECPKPPGAFYIFPAAEKLGLSGTDLMFKLLDHGVAIAPGELFGEDFKYHFRMCYAMPEDLVKEGLERMKSFFQQLKQGVK